ncbi:MAG: PepSY domain-containing protein [Synergistaceae bacterium]|nr:PepSY domain-containing protein [Synergistaceae bacterium]
MKKLCALLIGVIVLNVCGGAFADHEGRYVREEAARRNIALLTEREAREIAAETLGTESFRVKELELEDESDDYPNAENFRPVYKLECVSGRDEYDIEIDAVTGKVLKFELDD